MATDDQAKTDTAEQAPAEQAPGPGAEQAAERADESATESVTDSSAADEQATAAVDEQPPAEPAAQPPAEPAAQPDEGKQPAAEGEQPAAEGEGKKKRRRRRRKRKGDGPADEGSVAGADGGKAGDKTSRGPKPERERPAFNPGDQVFGKVSKVTDVAIWVDIAGKAPGLFDRRALTAKPSKEAEPKETAPKEAEEPKAEEPKAEPKEAEPKEAAPKEAAPKEAEPPTEVEPPKVGDQFIAKVQSCSNRGGMIILVNEPIKPTDAKAAVREASEKKEPIDGFVTGVIKGGVEVDLQGLRAFGPASQVDLRPNADLSYLVGERLPFLITNYGKKGRDIVVSRRKSLEKKAKKLRAEQLAKIKPDAVCKGVVRNVLGWGAFVALPEYGDIEGVVHMTEASHDRGAKLSEVFSVGAEIEVKVLRIDEKGKLWLSHKAMQKHPWVDAAKKYPQGSRHQGKVVRLTDFGAFIQLEPGVDGLCHIADLSLLSVDHPKEVVDIGQKLEVVVAHLDERGNKMSLHPVPAEADQFDKLRTRVKPYEKVRAAVVKVVDNGLLARILGVTGRGQRAFLPAVQTGTPRGTDLRKEFPVGKEFEAKVLEVDNRKGEAKLSVRALKEEAEKQAYREYRKKVQREARFGTFADLLKKS